VPLEPTGFVGVWLKTDDPGVTVQLAIDDPVAEGATAIEKGAVRTVLADDQWHLYQWNLEDANDWIAFGNAGSDGDIDATGGMVTIDSIFFSGAGSVQIYMDTLSHNPEGPLTAAGDFNRDGVVDSADLTAWADGAGAATGAAFTDGDGDGDGDVDGRDFLAWQRTLGMSNTAAATATAASIPEPMLHVMLAGLGIAASSFPRRRLAFSTLCAGR
jgi:hypothetical protein